MKPHKSVKLFFVFCLWFLIGELYAQPLQVSATATVSVCFNDGSITANATGGSLPYDFVLTSGPTIAGMIYPFPPTNLVNEFLSIPSGTYTLVVYDNAGDSSQTAVVVPGNYQFPTANYVISGGITITVTAYSGTPPYTYAISSVASNGPFSPQQTSNVFDTLCNGTYYIRVTDACSNIYTTPGIIINRPPTNINSTSCYSAGSNLHTIQVFLQAGTGTPPYSYQCLSGGNNIRNNTGYFANVPGLCPDTIIITDGCGVWDSIRRDCLNMILNVTCCDCVNGMVHLSASGGSPPYTYTYIQNNIAISSNQTGIFTNLPPRSASGFYYFQFEDNCGRKKLGRVDCLNPQFYTTCPFNNDVEVYLWGTVDLPATITCSTCIPTRTVTISGYDTLFQNVTAGIHTFTVTDNCGAPVTTTVVVDTAAIHLHSDWRSCNDITLTAHNSFGVYTTNTYVLTSNSGYNSTNTTGLFDNLPPGLYTATANYPLCEPDILQFWAPNMPDFCLYPTYNSTCTASYDLRSDDFFFSGDLNERISFVSSALGISQVESPPTANNGMNFNDLPVGNYNLVSDSGCSVPYILPVHPSVALSAYDSVDCIDDQFIIASAQPNFFRNTCSDTTKFTYRVYKDDSLIATNITGRFLVPDTGDYVVKIFYRVNNPARYPAVPYNFNDSCFVDSVHIHARPRTLPVIFAEDKQVCSIDELTTLPYSISGGVVPYTLHVPGVGTYPVRGTQGVLDSLGVDNYTLIAYDNCGISNSLTVTIADTCFVCGTLSRFLPLDTNVCAGTTVAYTDTSEHVQQYNWYVNDSLVSNQQVLNYRFDSLGYYTIMSIAANISCIDTTIHIIRAFATNSFSLGSDISICPGDMATLSSSMAVVWSTGLTGSQIQVDQPGLYWASLASACGVFADTVQVTYRNIIPPSLGAGQTLCAGDSFIIGAGNTYTDYLWQDGSIDSTYVIRAPGLYWVEVISDSCPVRDSILITAGTPLPVFFLGNDTLYCESFSRILETPYSNTNWSTGATGFQIQVNSPAVYWAEVQNNCGAHRDSILLRQITIPGFTLGPDTFICDHAPYLLNGPTGIDSVKWFDGSSLSQSEVTTAGTYWISYYREGCQWSDTIHVENFITPQLEMAKDVAECGEAFNISPGLTGVNYLWSDGSGGSSLDVTQSGTYSVTATNFCGSDSEDVNVFLMGNDCRVVFPNAFTPNDDGKNDVFKARSLCDAGSFTLRIYNRWGELIFQSTDIQNGWNGFYEGTEQASGTYVVYISYFDDCEQAMNHLQGNITLLR